MPRRKLEEENIRSLMKLGSSFAVTVPMEFVRKLKWKEKQKLEMSLSNDKIIIKDWKKKSS